MPKAILTISSRNYGAWALRGWLMANWPSWISPNTWCRPTIPR